MITFSTAWINTFSNWKLEEPLYYNDTLVNGFGKTMEKFGHKWEIKQDEKTAKPADWIPRHAPTSFDSYQCPDKGNSMAPGSGVDTVDFAIIASHGGLFKARAWDKTSPLFVSVGFNQPGGGGCRFCSTQTRFGSGKLKWLILDACHSLEIDVPNGINPWSIWHESFHGLHTIFGYTGRSVDSWWYADRAEFFAHYICQGVEMADAWISCAYSWKVDQYPVAASVGRDSKDADTRLETETLTSSFGNIPNKEVKNIVWMWRS